MRGRPEPRSDVFSLGAMVYALVAGRPPRRDGDQAAREPVDADTTAREPVDAYIAAREAARGTVALDLDVGPLTGVLAAMLRRDPGERPDAADARRRLEEIAAPAGPIPALAAGPDHEPDPGGLPALVRDLPALVRALPDRVRGLPASSGPPGGRGRDGAAHRGRPRRRRRAVGLGRADHRRPAPAAGAPTGGTPLDVVGDRRTVDPCALLRPAALVRFGRTELDPDYGNFDRCDVLIHPRPTPSWTSGWTSTSIPRPSGAARRGPRGS
ncbi:hypothetical protein ACFQYP_08765 [Nonomuraea antimicrobica]